MPQSKNKVWYYVDRPKYKKVIDSQWIFKLKESQGQKKGTARLVVRGFKDTNDYELQETYAPVARRPTVFSNLAIINKLNLEVSQMDVKTTFLNGKLETKEIYMEIPDGIECSKKFKSVIWSMHKSTKKEPTFHQIHDYSKFHCLPIRYLSIQMEGRKSFYHTVIICRRYAYS